MMQDAQISVRGVRLWGEYQAPDGADSARPAVVLCHGFAGQLAIKLRDLLVSQGFATLLFKFHGYPPSGGGPAHFSLKEQVEDTFAATGYLRAQPGVDPGRIGVAGSSLGATVALMALQAGLPVQACGAVCPIATGAAFMATDACRARGQREITATEIAEFERTGRRIPRYDIVNIPEPLRGYLPPETPMEFSPDTVDALRRVDVVAAIRKPLLAPVLLMHAKDDQVVPFEQSESLAAAAGSRLCFAPLNEGNHFLIGNPVAMYAIAAWLSALLRAR